MSKLQVNIPYQFKAETIIQEGRTTRAHIQEILEWLPTVHLPLFQEETICLFLVSCCNDIALVKKTVLSYFRLKNAAPEIFFDRDVDSAVLTKAMNVIICVSIPRRLPNNTVIHFFKLQDTNYKNFDLVNNMKLGFMLIDVSQRYNPPNELVCIIDMKGATAMHLTCVKLGAIKKFIDFMQEGMAFKIQRIHILNTNYVFDKALAIAKLFMKGELLKLIVPHSPKLKMEDFHRDWVPASCLPEEYGGDLPSVNELNQLTIEQFREMRSYFEAEERLVRSLSSKQ